MLNQDSIKGIKDGKFVWSNKDKTKVKFISTDSKWKQAGRLLGIRLICF